MDLITIVVVLIIGLGAIFVFINSKIKELKNSKENDQSQKLMLDLLNNLRRDLHADSGSNRQEIQNRLDKISEALNHGMDKSSETLERQFKESRILIKEASTRIAQFEQTNKKIADFAGQLKSLEDVLKNPKQRGILGEYYLETMLKNVFEPGQYQMQYSFSNGVVVDAVIFYQGKILPIDSKFSMENYNRMVTEKNKERRELLVRKLIENVKERINETAKYIRIKDNTFDFAFMFIPSEGVYYDMLTAEVGSLRESSFNLMEYAHKKNVIPVSPTSFYAYLQTLLHGLRIIDMKESMNEIIKKVGQLDRHLKNYEIYYRKIGSNLSNTVGAYNNSTLEFAKIDKDVYRITEGEHGGNEKIKEITRPL